MKRRANRKSPLVPLAVLLVLGIAAFTYISKKRAEREVNSQSVERYCLQVCASSSLCVERVRDIFPQCFDAAYEPSLTFGGDVLDLQHFLECMNGDTIWTQQVLTIVPGEAPFPTK